MTDTYKVALQPLHARKQLIANLSQSPIGTVVSHEVYEGVPTQLKIVRLPLDVPVYRMENGRTQTKQLAFLSEKKDLPSDYFSAGQENNVAQQTQHRILHAFAQEGGDSVTPIKDELARSKQTEPLLISPSGIVVNGNRRLAAMRELYSESSADYPTFSGVDCAILPQLTAEQEDDVEIDLQMRPETKLPYGWIDEAMKIRKRIGKDEDKLARRMRKKTKDLRKAVSALQYAEIYLQDWRKDPLNYALVEPGEQFFGDLVGRMQKKEGQLREANLRMAWILFDKRASLGGRIYEYNRVLGEKAVDVLAKVGERLEVDMPAEQDEGTEEEELEIDIGADDPATDGYDGLIALFDDNDRRDEVFDELRRVCQTIIDVGNEEKVGSSALVAARDANTRLTELDLTRADQKTFDAIDKQLVAIIERATDLRSKLASKKTPIKSADGVA